MIPHRAFPDISMDALQAEILREEQQRRRFYPTRVDKGLMTRDECDHGIAVAAAWREDAGRIRDCWFGDGTIPPPPPGHGFTWHDLRATLRHELAMRDRAYPGWVAGGRMTEDQAAHRIACLACLLEIYEDGWDARGRNGARPRLYAWPGTRTAEEREAAVEFWHVQIESGTRTGNEAKAEQARQALRREGVSPPPTKQQEMAL